MSESEAFRQAYMFWLMCNGIQVQVPPRWQQTGGREVRLSRTTRGEMASRNDEPSCCGSGSSLTPSWRS